MPDLFEPILDQSEPIRQILNAYEQSRLPHGLIFAGPVGVGKATTARALAKFFLADQGQDLYAMRLIDAQTHPDYHVVTRDLIRLTSKTSKATTLSIDVIRNHLIEPAMKKSVTGTGKVFVVEEADRMQPAAQNALLKTLEEPFERTLIILLTPLPELLLPTIRSRTQLFRFGQLRHETVFNQLKLRGIDPKTARMAADLADGSLGIALEWIEDGVIERASDLISHLEGLLTRHTAFDLSEWLKQSADAYADQQIQKDELASKDHATRQGIRIYLRLICRCLQNHLRQTQDPERLESICQSIDAIHRCEVYLSGNVNISLAIQQLSTRLNQLHSLSFTMTR